MEIISPRLQSENGVKPHHLEKPDTSKKEVAPNVKLHAAIAKVIKSSIENSLKTATRHAASHMRYNIRIAGYRSERQLPPGAIEVSGKCYDGSSYSISVIAADTQQQKKILVFISKDTGDELLVDHYELDQVARVAGGTRLVVDAVPIAVADLQSVIDEAFDGSAVEIYVTNVTSDGKSVDPLMMTQNGY